jgi:hypothetical protein
MRGDTFLDTLARFSSYFLHDVSCSYSLDLDRVILDLHQKHDRASSTMVQLTFMQTPQMLYAFLYGMEWFLFASFEIPCINNYLETLM